MHYIIIFHSMQFIVVDDTAMLQHKDTPRKKIQMFITKYSGMRRVNPSK